MVVSATREEQTETAILTAMNHGTVELTRRRLDSLSDSVNFGLRAIGQSVKAGRDSAGHRPGPVRVHCTEQ
eukprot:763767-Hanusia_phi.AAC.5